MGNIHNVLVTAKVITGKLIHIEQFNVPIRNAYELQTFIDDLDLRFDCVLEVSASPLLASLN